MPRRREHLVLGSVAGLATAVIAAREEAPEDIFWEALGGGLAGALCSQIPDIIEPALHPGHRSVAHAVVPASVAGAAVWQPLPELQSSLRRRANEFRERQAHADPNQQFWLLIAELACRLAAGALVGGAAGYVSHLCLDAGTARRLPILG